MTDDYASSIDAQARDLDPLVEAKWWPITHECAKFWAAPKEWEYAVQTGQPRPNMTNWPRALVAAYMNNPNGKVFVGTGPTRAAARAAAIYKALYAEQEEVES